MRTNTQFTREQKAHRKNELIEWALDAGIVPLYNDKQKDIKLIRRLRELSLDDLRDQLNRWEKASRAKLSEVSIIEG